MSIEQPTFRALNSQHDTESTTTFPTLDLTHYGVQILAGFLQRSRTPARGSHMTLHTN